MTEAANNIITMEMKQEPAEVPAADDDAWQSMPTSSREQMLEHGGRFVRFVRSKNPSADPRTMDERALNEYLRFFYFTLTTKQGGRYSPSSLICIRAGIQRYLELVLGRKVNLPGNPTFMTSNRMLGQRAREFSSGSGNSRHYRPISASDMELLSNYFNGSRIGQCSVEERLQDEVLFSLLYHLGCGQQQQQQQLRPMRRDWLVFSVDDEGREFASLSESAQGSSSRNSSTGPRIYSVEKLKFYMSLLPQKTKDNSLFPKPMRGGKFSSGSSRGINYMQNFMRNLSKKAGLEQLYSNHSIRLTRIQDLHRSGLSAESIRSITGHKCDKSVKRCLRWGAASTAAADSRWTGAAAAAGVDGDAKDENGADDEEELELLGRRDFDVMDETSERLE